MFVFVIKNVRKSKNITLYRLMKLTGLSYSYLSKLENNIDLLLNVKGTFKNTEN